MIVLSSCPSTTRNNGCFNALVYYSRIQLNPRQVGPQYSFEVYRILTDLVRYRMVTTEAHKLGAIPDAH
jgi:hypothetical protein